MRLMRSELLTNPVESFKYGNGLSQWQIRRFDKPLGDSSSRLHRFVTESSSGCSDVKFPGAHYRTIQRGDRYPSRYIEGTVETECPVGACDKSTSRGWSGQGREQSGQRTTFVLQKAHT
jgi:hypothetical protein